ncbi:MULTISPECIES: flagellar hook-length control protein FliK [Gammaproteobacteria]|uniref:flagellar hook-length control protein FliK n=1 Tax=Gammaproteobacteria TaxID=1236 RepID=UPI000DD0BE77|nr:MULTISPECIES: flagellar hook-length control protein FliK [Gammaproteobacteria]RTE85456.1 flagellar hook-length control protein FliK [Aliidiomarina sp. B3213]TCZ89423.1 flagellar hook-length control protein FliK [Lysobacter sp. N42]
MQTQPVIPSQVTLNKQDSAPGRSSSASSESDFESALYQEEQKHQSDSRKTDEAAKIAGNRERTETDTSARNEPLNERSEERSRRNSDTATEQEQKADNVAREDVTDKKESDESKDKDWHSFLESVYHRLQESQEEGSDSKTVRLDTLPLYHGDPVSDEGRVLKFEVEKSQDEVNVKELSEDASQSGDSDSDEQSRDANAEQSGNVNEDNGDVSEFLKKLQPELSEGDADQLAELLNGEVSLEQMTDEQKELLNAFFSELDISEFQQQITELSQDSLTQLGVSLESLEQLQAQIDRLASAEFGLSTEKANELDQLQLRMNEWVEALKDIKAELSQALVDLKQGDSSALEQLLASLNISDEQKNALQQELEAIAQRFDVEQLQRFATEQIKAAPQLQSAAAEVINVANNASNKENPVLKAFENASNKARLLQQAEGAGDADVEVKNDGDKNNNAVQRLLDVVVQSQATEQNKTPTQPAATNPTTTATAQSQNGFSQQMSQAQQAAQQTPLEQARQVQQHIDLFGPQAPQNMRDQVMAMVNSKQQFAEMRLDPPELGKLQIRIQMNSENQASVQFQVNSPQAREAVEQSLPKLKEMLEQQGLQLADTDVKEGSAEQQQFAQQSGSGTNGQGHGGEGENTEINEPDSMHTQWIDVDSGRVDYYA